MRVELPCCNPKHGCPHCHCIRCWNDGKLPECNKIKDKPHIKTSLLCTHCIKDIKGICLQHYWVSLLDMREIKHEKLQIPEYKQKVCKEYFYKWLTNFNKD